MEGIFSSRLEIRRRGLLLGGLAAGLGAGLDARLGASGATTSTVPNTAASARLAGTYAPKGTAPAFDLTDPVRLRGLLDKRASPVVAAALAELTRDVDAIVLAPGTLGSPTTGTDLHAYMQGFSLAPTGAAPRLLRLALYIRLASMGRGFGDPHRAEAARALCLAGFKRWTEAGFTEAGAPLLQARQFVLRSASAGGEDAQDATMVVGMQLGRGMIPFTLALTLLTGADSSSDRLDTACTPFIKRMLALVVDSATAHATQPLVCGRFDNQTSTHIHAILTMARYLGDGDLLTAMAGQPSRTRLPFSWPAEIDGAIYGIGDTPRPCFDPSTTSRTGYRQTGIVAPGEIVDRFRAKPHQPFGYTSASLTAMLLGARILQSAGFDALGYQGPRQQSPRGALDYYAFYQSHFLSDHETSLPGSGISYPDYAQYAGDPFERASGASVENKDQMLTPFILGAKFFPADANIRSVIEKARSFKGLIPFYAIDPSCLDALQAVA